MNPLLDRLNPYPFERWAALTKHLDIARTRAPINLGIGEPKHETPVLIKQALIEQLNGLQSYPATAGLPVLRDACAAWVERRYGVKLDATSQVLPVNGSREALFALAQTVVDATRDGATVVCPNPFYQIYEGAALLAGARVAFANSDPSRNFAPRWEDIDDATWSRTQLVYVCSPGNPTGAVMNHDEWARLFALSDRHGFVIASDECYSEIYFGDEPPLGALQAAKSLGRDSFERLVVLTSLSKRSNVPGMRSGFVAGDATIMRKFLLYRTYHGSAMSPTVQHASAAAWRDEAHVQANREMYRRKFEAVTPILSKVLDVKLPDASFYLWAGVGHAMQADNRRDGSAADATDASDIVYAQGLLAQYNVTVLPGTLLARAAHGVNPGNGRIRLALVASIDECIEAAQRIVDYTRKLNTA